MSGSRRSRSGGVVVALALVLSSGFPSGATGAPGEIRIAPFVDAGLTDLESLYRELHAAPELSLREVETAARLAREMRAAGFAVTEAVGGTGLVALLENGDGPTVMLRTDTDALPVREATGLPYASAVEVTGDDGRPTGVMHACGHDLHMTAWVGAARWLAAHRDSWSGTAMFVAQPAEERGLGARAMLEDGLFTRFPRPDAVLGLHTAPFLAAGRVGVVPGYALASVDSVDVTIHGVGSHGAMPHLSVDPIVIGARLVGALQTIVAREVDPLKPAVVTVGSFHAGTKHNIIPDRAELQLTVRAYDPDVRADVLSAIERLAMAEAAAAGAPRAPEVVVSEGTPVTENDGELSRRLIAAFRRELGDAAIGEPPQVMAGEDFSRYGLEGIPAVIYWVGGPSEETLERAAAGEIPAPALHRPDFAPEPRPSIRTAVRAHVAAFLEIAGRGNAGSQ